ncbi:MAG: radical SAM protein [Bacillota bacterium]
MKKAEQEVNKLLGKAWKTRKLFFPDQIEFSAPNRTLSVSVTGSSCSLNCAHCNGVYLHKMATIETALASKKGREKSYLVSGGSDPRGKVPLLEKWAELEELADRGPINLHTGLVTEEEAMRLAQIATVVSFDFMGDNETINRVYGLSATVEDYLDSYRYLQKYVSVIPHICIGLNGGIIKGEYEALKYLQQEAVEAISLIIFRPTEGTVFKDCKAPPLDEAARFMATTRLMFPRIPLYLGCMRPSGRYRETVDTYALRAGFNKIVLPAPAARLKAEELGLEISISEECCSL